MSDFLGAISANGKRYAFVDVGRALPGYPVATMPRSTRLLVENVARNAPEEIPSLVEWLAGREGSHELPFQPSRILMHDTTCLPALADFAAMRDAVAMQGGDPRRVNPTLPIDLVIDHSIAADDFGHADSASRNLARDFDRNAERYRFVKWACASLANFRVVPPGTGIIHQVNMEYLAEVVRVELREGSDPLVTPDTLLGTDSHTPMINALGILGWGVGGIESQAAMVGEPVALAFPRVVGVRLAGAPRPGITATDIVLDLTRTLRAHGVVGKFVEFFGPGVARLSLADRATMANMAPEYGATVSFFPIDATTLAYLRSSGRPEDRVQLVEAYARAQGLWLDDAAPEIACDERVEYDLGAVEPCVAGPSLPDERKRLGEVASSFARELPAIGRNPELKTPRTLTRPGAPYPLADGLVALAAITSCTNTSNPALVVGAGLLARNAVRRGLRTPPWVKTTLSPGSRVVSDYLRASGLQGDLDALGFHVVGHGCMTCIGNSGRLQEAVVEAVEQEGLCAVGVLSGNRNFHGRVNPHLAAAYLASPALVVAYALAGRITCDLTRDPIGIDGNGAPVLLADIWPAPEEIDAVIARHVSARLYVERYADVRMGTPEWQRIEAPADLRFPWDEQSTYIRRPPHVESFTRDLPPPLALREARVLLSLGDSVTTDHISPAGPIPPDSLAGRHLLERGVPVGEFNQYATRRSNHEVMLRGAFSNPRLRNELLGEAASPANLALAEDGVTALPAFEAAATYRLKGVPLVILAGRNYGAGSSRDWGAKAPRLLGVRAILAESFERIHRSNLIGMGIVPITLPPGLTRKDIARTGRESLTFTGLDELRVGRNPVHLTVASGTQPPRQFLLACDIDSRRELRTLREGGFLPLVVRSALSHPTKELP